MRTYNESFLSARLRVGQSMITALCGIILLNVAVGTSHAHVHFGNETSEEVAVVSELDQPFLFSYLSWQDRARVESGIALIKGVDNRGGAGINTELDLGKWSDASPALLVKIGPMNQMKSLRLMLVDKDGRHGIWNFPLDGTPSGGKQWQWITPAQGASLSLPHDTKSELPGPPNLQRITQWQLSGDWVGTVPADIEVDRIVIVLPTAEMKAQQQVLAEAVRKSALDAKRERDELFQRYSKRSALSPKVVAVSMVSPDIMSIEIQAGEWTRAKMELYVKQPKDEVREDKNAKGQVEKRVLFRDGVGVGNIVGEGQQWLTYWERVHGDPLLEFLADDTESYKVQSSTDPNYSLPTAPIACFRKSRPAHWAQGSNELAVHHTVYLKLPKAIVGGNQYSVTFSALNTQSEEANLRWNPVKIRSEAVHVNQIGYRPSDPLKRAFLSCWLGTGGPLKLPKALRFSLVDTKTDKKIFDGQGELHFPADKLEQMARDSNFNGTDVARLDFSAFKTPGEYRLVVEGVGCSYPFTIGDRVWTTAFLTQMRGLYHNRTGIELGPPYTDFRKPRDMHPDDGYSVTHTTYRAVEKGGEAWIEIPGGDTGKPANGWGGYHDAGDWNPRRVSHMKVTMAMLELLDLFPKHFAALDLRIPKTKGLPDILTEAVFEFSCFRRLQNENGGVGYGLESRADPIEGEVSWVNTFPSYAFAPDYAASWYYAAVGARLSRLLKPYDAVLAKDYESSAIRAFQFAEQDFAAEKIAGKIAARDATWNAIDDRNLAALELYRLTKDQQYHDLFLQDTALADDRPKLFEWSRHVQRDHAFHYARLPKGLGDQKLKDKAISAIVEQAELSIHYAEGNAFNLTTCDKGKPQFLGFYSTPDSIDLVHAHILTKDEKYLSAVIQSTQFQSGCNPNNIVYITGLGANPLKNVFKLDARRTGQNVPAGLVPYGNIDFAKWNHEGITWPITWTIGKVMKPSAYEWPTHEAYWDLGGWPMLEEFTVDVWAPNVLVWGYLSART